MVSRVWTNTIASIALTVAFGLMPGSSTAEAGLVNGSQALNLVSIAPNSGSLATIPTFTINFAATGSQTGDFVGGPSGLDALTLLNTASNVGLTLGSLSFGTFTATSETVDIAAGGRSKTFDLLGTFSPGTDPHWVTLGASGTSSAELIISLNQAGGGTNAIGASATLFAFGQVAPPPTTDGSAPEPASITLWGLGALGMAFVAIRQKRKGQAAA